MMVLVPSTSMWGLDFDAIQKAGSLAGAGAMVVMDETTCMVDAARRYGEVLPSRELRQVHALPRRHLLDVESLRSLRGRRREARRHRPAARDGYNMRRSFCPLGDARPGSRAASSSTSATSPRHISKRAALQEDRAGGGRLMATVQTDQVTLTIDGSPSRCEGTLISTRQRPSTSTSRSFCSHPKMAPVAAAECAWSRSEKVRNLQPACAVYVAEGMVVKETTEQVGKYQKGVLEFLLNNILSTARSATKGGECPLQDRPFNTARRQPLRVSEGALRQGVPLSDKIVLDRKRCICAGAARAQRGDLGRARAGADPARRHTIIGTFMTNRPVELQGNWTEICPVGALTSRQYRFVSRPWDLDRTASVLPVAAWAATSSSDARSNRSRRFSVSGKSRVATAGSAIWAATASPVPAHRAGPAQVRRDGTLEQVTYDEVIAFTADALQQAGGHVAGWASPRQATRNSPLPGLSARCSRRRPGSPKRGPRDAEPDDMTLRSPTSSAATTSWCWAAGCHRRRAGAPPSFVKSQSARIASLEVGAADVKKALDAVPAEAECWDPRDRGNKKAAVELQSSSSRSEGTSALIVTTGPNGRGAKDLGILPHSGRLRLAQWKVREGRVEWPGAGVKALYVTSPARCTASSPLMPNRCGCPDCRRDLHRFKPSPWTRSPTSSSPGTPSLRRTAR